MYDMPHAIDAHDRLWTSIRDALREGPENLDRTTDVWTGWQSEKLLVSQTCGLPFRARLFDAVTLVGTPDYGLRDCPPGYYFSYLIRRRGDRRSLHALAREGAFAYNDGLSQSGWAAPWAQLAQIGLAPGTRVQTGSHIASAMAVANGSADYAGIDAVTYQMWSQIASETAAQLETFLRTDPTPGLPLITAKSRDPEPIARAVTRAIERMPPQDREVLYLKGLVRIPAATYRALKIPQMP
ncbi:MAG: PhnD/SsuA/transferrin family substrate-binding protein [Pseudomonadota bacterium]